MKKSLWKWLEDKRIKNKKEKERMKKKYESLSLVGRNSYDGIMEREDKSFIPFIDTMWGLVKVIIILALFSSSLTYLFWYNTAFETLRIQFGVIVIILVNLFLITLLFMMIWSFFIDRRISKLRRKLLLGE